MLIIKLETEEERKDFFEILSTFAKSEKEKLDSREDVEKIIFSENEYAFLSNAFKTPIEFRNHLYSNAEAAFQSLKTIDESAIPQFFTTLDAHEAKMLGRKLPLRFDWEEVKEDIMYDVCRCKFVQNLGLRQKLLDTGDAVLEQKTSNDTFWGTVNGKGENKLGKILMKIRNELREIEHEETVTFNVSKIQPLIKYIAYEKYKKEWLKDRIVSNSECYVCLSEFLMNEYKDEEYMKEILTDEEFNAYLLDIS
ncbi:MAG: NADAR family protein [Lachnospiraceae bacterium]|nr:NADAR family protein [Lachnospiraceae bacterium]